MLVCSLSRSHRFYCSIHFIFLHLVPPFGWRKAAADLYFDMNYISLRKKRCGMLTSIIFHPSLLYYSRIWPVCLSHCHPVLATGRHLRTQLIQTTCQGYSHGHDAFRVADVPKSQTVRWSEFFSNVVSISQGSFYRWSWGIINHDMGFSIHGGTPIDGWFTSWKIRKYHGWFGGTPMT